MHTSFYFMLTTKKDFFVNTKWSVWHSPFSQFCFVFSFGIFPGSLIVWPRPFLFFLYFGFLSGRQTKRFFNIFSNLTWLLSYFWRLKKRATKEKKHCIKGTFEKRINNVVPNYEYYLLQISIQVFDYNSYL